jgi:Transglycosylase SLT domain
MGATAMSLADGRTALSEHRRRSPGKRRGGRRAGILLPTAATAATAVTGIVIAGYLVVFRPGNVPNSGAAMAAAAVSGSRAVAVLEEQRQQMIVMSAAAHSMHLVGRPKLAAQPSAGNSGGTGQGTPAGTGVVPLPAPDPGTAKRIAYDLLSSYGWDPSTSFPCLDDIYTRESNWNARAENASGAYGIPQALPASKMASAGADYLTNPRTQIVWGLGYIQSTYGDPCSAWSFWQAHGYY